MPRFDREGLIRLLERLGSADDAEVLAAAREVDRRVAAAGLDWDEVVAGAAERGGAIGAPAAADAAQWSEDGAEEIDDLALIDRILRDFEITESTRADLGDFKRDIGAGEFTAADRRYLRSLYTRLRSTRAGKG